MRLFSMYNREQKYYVLACFVCRQLASSLGSKEIIDNDIFKEIMEFY